MYRPPSFKLHIKYSVIKKYLGVNADDFAAFLAAIGEYALVTLNAVRMLVSENVTLSC